MRQVTSEKSERAEELKLGFVLHKRKRKTVVGSTWVSFPLESKEI